VVSFTPQPLYPQGKSSRYPLNRRLGEPQSHSGHGGEGKTSHNNNNNNNNNNNDDDDDDDDVRRTILITRRRLMVQENKASAWHGRVQRKD
jgi:hypothetical protein